MTPVTNDFTLANIYQWFIYPLVWASVGSILTLLVYFFLKRLLSKKILQFKKLWIDYYSENSLQLPGMVRINEGDLVRRLSRRDLRILHDVAEDDAFLLQFKWHEKFLIKHISLVLKTLKVFLNLTLLIVFFQNISYLLRSLVEAFEGEKRVFLISHDFLKKFYSLLQQVEFYTIKIIVLLLGAVWLSHVLQEVIHMVLTRSAFDQDDPRAKVRAETLEVVAVYVSKIVVFLAILIFILRLFDINMSALVATAGLASFSLGFAAQPLVRDFFSGFFFILEDQFAVGDFVRVNERAGVVESLTLRITRLRGTDGTVHVIPNGEVRVVENMTSAWSRIDLTLLVDLDSPIPKVLKVLNEECYKLYLNFRDIVLEPPSILGVESVTQDGITVRAFIKTAAGEQWSLKRELNLRLLHRFKAENLNFPRKQIETMFKS
jgi:small conductance mechanosensitive channel